MSGVATELWVAVAGSLGAGSRYVLDAAIRARLGTRLPWGTVAINVTGSLLLGLVIGLCLFQGAPDGLRVYLGLGFCGGYTTFSTASVESVQLWELGRRGAAVANTAGTLVLTVAAGGLGMALARW